MLGGRGSGAFQVIGLRAAVLCTGFCGVAEERVVVQSGFPRIGARKAACGREIDIRSRDGLSPLVHVRVDWGVSTSIAHYSAVEERPCIEARDILQTLLLPRLFTATISKIKTLGNSELLQPFN